MSNFSSVNSLPSGDYAEVGVFQGDGAKEISEWMNKDSHLWLFDSCAGHAEPCEYDDVSHHHKGRYSDTSPELILSKAPKATLLVGYVPSTFTSVNDRKFRFVRIDVDHYIPTLAACKFFKDRMVPGGIIEFDDYAITCCEGATKAVDEVFGAANIRVPVPHWVNE